MLELILYFGPVILVVLLVLLIITQGYVKAPPDHAYIISGLRKEPRVLVGRAGLKLPFFEQLDKLYLGRSPLTLKQMSTFLLMILSMLWWTLLQRYVCR